MSVRQGGGSRSPAPMPDRTPAEEIPPMFHPDTSLDLPAGYDLLAELAASLLIDKQIRCRSAQQPVDLLPFREVMRRGRTTAWWEAFPCLRLPDRDLSISNWRCLDFQSADMNGTRATRYSEIQQCRAQRDKPSAAGSASAHRRRRPGARHSARVRPHASLHGRARRSNGHRRAGCGRSACSVPLPAVPGGGACRRHGRRGGT